MSCNRTSLLRGLRSESTLCSIRKLPTLSLCVLDGDVIVNPAFWPTPLRHLRKGQI